MLLLRLGRLPYEAEWLDNLICSFQIVAQSLRWMDMDGQELGWDHGAGVVDRGDRCEGEAVADRGVRVRSGVLLDMDPDC
jgi:hypothetical protein